MGCILPVVSPLSRDGSISRILAIVACWHGAESRRQNQPPDLILGQDAPNLGLENRGRSTGADSFRSPCAIAGNDQVLYIADAGNHRVLGWSPLPETDRPADVVLGQEDCVSSREFPYGAQGSHRMRFPYGLALENQTLAVADSANHRVLLFHTLYRSGAGYPADVVLGQINFDANGENRWKAVAPDTLSSPFGLCFHEGRLAVSDSGNNRIMIWQTGRLL
ncbi:MAG: hypothetical protein U0694_09290 [Anaerolineae bacterium]